jgi:hypothetical protein
MKFISTVAVARREFGPRCAGLAPDGGLYMPKLAALPLRLRWRRELPNRR